MKNLVWLTVLLSMVLSLAYAASGNPTWYPKDKPLLVGKVVKLSSTKIAFDDEYYDLSPTVKVSTLTAEKAALSSIKRDDWVGLKFFIFNGKRYVDHIYEMYLHTNDIGN